MPVFRDTLTNVSKSWIKEVEYGSKPADYPWQLNGLPAENSLILTPDYPLSIGVPRLVWHCESNPAGSADGGYISPKMDIDKNALYQRVSYIKKLKSKDGSSYFGAYGFNDKNANIGLINNKTGKNNKNPYFWSGDLPSTDKWYLLVAYIHPANTRNTGIKKGGIYDMETSERIKDITHEFRWNKAAAKVSIRDYLFYTAKNKTSQKMFLPSLEKVDGREMPINILLGLNQ